MRVASAGCPGFTFQSFHIAEIYICQRMYYIKPWLLIWLLVFSFPPQQSATLQKIYLDMITVKVPDLTFAFNKILQLLMFKRKQHARVHDKVQRPSYVKIVISYHSATFTDNNEVRAYDSDLRITCWPPVSHMSFEMSEHFVWSNMIVTAEKLNYVTAAHIGWVRLPPAVCYV